MSTPQVRAARRPRSRSVVEPPAEAFLCSETERRRMLAAALGVAAGEVGAVAVERIRRRLDRATAWLRAEVRGRSLDLVAKLDPGDDGARALRVIRALRRAGLAPPAVATVPAALGHLAADRLLLLERAPGPSWLDEVLAGRGAAASERAADWLLAFQSLELPLLPARRAGASVTTICHDLGERLPELAADLRRWRRRLAPLGETDRPPAATSGWMPSHGDFHPKNLLIAPGRTTGVDLDEVALGDPAADAGSAVAQLLAMSFFETGSSAPGAAAAAAFWEHWARQAPGRRLEERAALHALATLLRVLHYSYALETSHRDLAHRWLPGLEAWWGGRRRGLAAGVDGFAEAT